VKFLSAANMLGVVRIPTAIFIRECVHKISTVFAFVPFNMFLKKNSEKNSILIQTEQEFR
jgi:hypothetical protein